MNDSYIGYVKIATLFKRFHRLMIPYLLPSSLDIDRNLVLVRCLK